MSMKAILFDLDGTLLDTLADLADAANRVLAQDGLPTHDHRAYRHFIGDGSRMLITRALPESHRTPKQVEDYLTRFKNDYRRHWKTATRPYPGIEDLLGELSRRQIPQAVVTNKPQVFAESCLLHFFPEESFRTPGPPLRLPTSCKWHRPIVCLSGTAMWICKPPVPPGCCPWARSGGFAPPKSSSAPGRPILCRTPGNFSNGLMGGPPHE